MPALTSGSQFPGSVSFTYVPYTPENDAVAACGIPVKYNASEEFKGKKVVLIGVPGAFTPTCQKLHLSSFISEWAALSQKGISNVIVIASNDQWVMAAWGKANGVKNSDIIFASDPDATFAKSVELNRDTRVRRFAMLIDDGVVNYLGTDDVPGQVGNTDAAAVLNALG